jgi:monothiol glutaredoxin
VSDPQEATNPDIPPRPQLEPMRIAAEARRQMAAFHSAVVAEVRAAVDRAPLVVVGMAQNPHVRNLRKVLDEAKVDYTYLEYGSYFSKWKERLAIKLWSGWPTFPQVFLKGVLLGGEALTLAALEDGSLKRTIAAGAS